MEDFIEVLNKGYVRLVDKMGTDLTPVNAARVSYNKQSKEMTERDRNLLEFLIRDNHSSPFRHAMLQFELHAPLMVTRQWWKYIVGSSHQDNMMAWNESSRRYITENPEFYIPDADAWRSKPANSKQGSGEPLPLELGQRMSDELIRHAWHSQELYENAMAEGVCAEQARLFLPAYSMYVRWYWTASLSGVVHFLNQRLAHDAQAEIVVYAQAVLELARKHFPISIEEMVKVE